MSGTRLDGSKPAPPVEHCRRAAAEPAGTSTAAAVAEPAPASTLAALPGLLPVTPSPTPASLSPTPASLSPLLACRSPPPATPSSPPLGTSPLLARDDWGLPEWLLKPNRRLGDAPPGSTADLSLEELSQRVDRAASESDAAMAAYHAARQSASQDLDRCVELVTTALAFDERSAFFTRALVARGAAASARDPREPSRGSAAAVAVAAEAQPESAAAARVVRLPTPPPVTAGKGSADGSPAASPRGIPATLETAADELPAHSLSVPAAGSVCDSELSFNDAATAPEPAPPVDLLEGDAASRTRRSRAPPEAGLAAPQVSPSEAAPQTGDASSTSAASGVSDAAATPPGARPVPASAHTALPLPQPAVPQVTDRKRLRETRDTPAAPLGARAASAATPPLPPAAAQPRRVGRSRVKDTRRRPASRGHSRASTRPTAKATRQPKKSRGEFRTGGCPLTRLFAVHLRSACCAGASGGATSGGRAASDPENSPLRPSYKVIAYWIASLSIDAGLPELHDVASLVISYVYDTERATAGANRALTESAFDLFAAKVSPTVTSAALLSAIKAVWSHVEPVRPWSGVTSTSLLPS